jgi:5-methyltetrahydropteroyltriglutamate--homocysteine methyltransferase
MPPASRFYDLVPDLAAGAARTLSSLRDHDNAAQRPAQQRRREYRMKTSTDRILTTHTGSLPRPKPLIDLILGREKGDAVAADTFEAATATAVDGIVAQQVEAGIDVVSDGEMSKPSYTTYIRHRVDGIALDPRAAEKGRDIMIGRDLLAHPDFVRTGNFAATGFPGCVGELRYKDRSALDRDIAHLKAAAAKSNPTEVFMTAPSPGILTRFIINLHYPSEDAYVAALADVLKVEYRAIVEAGFILQIDAPDLGSARNNQYRQLTDDEFRSKIAERNIAALNAAIEGLPADRIRLHICWGNYEGPHTHDLPVTKIIDIAFKAKVQAISIEAANPRHDHEWEDLKDIKIPDDKILIPGVIDSTTNFVEHPRLVAQRIQRYAQVIDRERLIAGVDCGFGTAVRTEPMVADSIVWAKLRALSEGAAIASKRLWGAKAA